MSLNLQIRRGTSGAWSLTGLPRHAAIEFDDLAEGLDYAKRHCAAAPAVIELFSDGIYVAVSQEAGWPHRLCRSVTSRGGNAAVAAEPDASRFAGIGVWLKRWAEQLRNGRSRLVPGA